MAPRGKSAAQRMAAATKKWKVGDLVLAKVRGFPAWPARVGEPEKWGHSAHSKKVVVCFFGCEQIAFCYPADIEEFTEEKKVSLLGKRHGKGADFGKAVNEIIECFEKFKKKNGSEEDNMVDGKNSEKSPTKPVKCEVPTEIAESLQTEITNDFSCPSETAMAEASLHDKEKQVPEPSSGLVLTEPLSSSGCTVNKTKITRVNGSWESRKSTLRSRSASRADTEGPGSGRSKHTRRFRRSSRIMKLSDDSEGQVADPNDGVSEESDSEIMSVESDTISINNGSASVFGSKSMGAEILTENNARETESSDRLDFQNETTIIKKKRMPSRKRLGSDITATAKFGVVFSDTEVLISSHASPSFSENLVQINVKDGDEHLPLVKRARLRMSRSSMKADVLMHETTNGSKDPEIPSLHCDNHKLDSFADVERVKEDQTNSSLSCVSPDGISQNWDLKKNSMDGEATLPPSKRIHRALEAMSANAVDDSEGALHDSPAVSVHSSNYYPSAKDFYELLVAQKDSVELVSEAAKDVDSHESDVPDVGYLDNDAKTILATLNCCETDVYNTNELNRESSELGKCSESDLVVNELHGNFDLTTSVKSSTSQKMSPTDHCKSGSSNIDNTEKKDLAILKMNSRYKFVEDVTDAPPPGFDIVISFDNANVKADDKCNNTSGFLMAKRPESHEEVILPILDSNVILTSFEFSDNGHDKHLLDSVSHEYAYDSTISVTQCSSSVTDGPNSSAKPSPHCSFKSNMSVTDNISQSPYSSLYPEKCKPSNKLSSREDYLMAFESMVGSLTRTKDSIGRATRMAIDAAKFALAPKVVEILVCFLERESNMHKKVNLFFLVDSIMQCSRTTKGDASVYPSAVQAMLPRLLSAAAPPCNSSNENHRQCLKVLKLWMEKKLLPEAIIRHRIKELEAFCCPYPVIGSRRPQRNERAFDDPVRQMEGMLVDEYGSNSSIQLPGFCMPPIRCESEGRNDSDEENSESVRHNIDAQVSERTSIPNVVKRICILEDVEGELEMEDVAPFCEAEATLANNNAAESTQILIREQDDAQLASLSSSRCESTHLLSSEICNMETRESVCNPSITSRVNSSSDIAHHRHQHENGSSEDQIPRKLSDSNNASCPTNQPKSHFSGRASSDYGFNRGFHVRPQQSQFPRDQSRRDNPPSSHYNRYRIRNSENGNFQRYRDRSKCSYRDVSGPPYHYNSSSCYGRMNHAPSSIGPPREPPFSNERWNCPPASDYWRPR